MKQHCYNCKYSVRDDRKSEYGEEMKVVYRCRRYAPRMICGAGTGWADWRHPEVNSHDWCGEWEEGSEK